MSDSSAGVSGYQYIFPKAAVPANGTSEPFLPNKSPISGRYESTDIKIGEIPAPFWSFPLPAQLIR
jgi:hypothetical protein